MARTKKTKPATAELATMLKGFGSDFAKLDAENAQLVQKMDELKRAGLIYATTFWRRKKRADGQEVRFLYLHYPAKGGKDRERVYVGSDQAKIDAALAGIERANEYDKLADQWRRIAERIDRVHDALATAKRYLENKPIQYGWTRSATTRGGHWQAHA